MVQATISRRRLVYQAPCNPDLGMQDKDRIRCERIVVICRAYGEDLGAIMVREGLALAFTRCNADYVTDEQRACAEPSGLHAQSCRDYRAKSRATVLS